MQLIKFPTFYIFSLFLVVMFSFSSCNKDDIIPPTIQLLSINDGDIYESNEVIPLEVNISDNETLVSYKVVIRNLSSNELEFVVSESADKAAITINDIFSTEVAIETTFEVELTAEDDSGNTTEQKVSFKVLPLPGSVLALNFKLKYQDNPLVMFEYYDYTPDDIQLYFTRFSFYISNIILVKADGSETLIKEVDFVNLTDDHQNATDAAKGTTYPIFVPEAAIGDYTAIKFAIGIPEALNAMKPANFSLSHPLGRSGEYWESWNSFIFTKTEGFIKTSDSETFDLGISLHTGSNEVYRSKTVELPITIDLNETATINFDIDLYNMLVQNNETYQLKDNAAIHSLSQIELAKQLADNLIQSIIKL